MKKIIFIIFTFLICNNGFAKLVCPSSDYLNNANRDYWDSNKDRQITGEAFDKLDEKEKKEAKIRNLCFGASLKWHSFCAFKDCKECDDKNLCTPVSMDYKILNISISKYCEYSNIDCFTENVDVVFSVLQESNDVAFGMFFSDTDINNITSDILNGKTINTSIIDIDKSVCYRTDNNGDTVWHAFARSNRDAWSFANLCVSLNENPLDMFINAVSKTKNKKGRTAVQDAIDSSNPDNIFGFLSAYARQEKKDYCNSLPQDISNTNNIDLKKVKTLLKCGS